MKRKTMTVEEYRAKVEELKRSGHKLSKLYRKVCGDDKDVDLVLNTLQDIIDSADGQLDAYEELEAIGNAVCRHYHVTGEQILSNDRAQTVVTARQVAMYIVREQMHEPFSSIAELFGKTTATVRHHIRTIMGRLDADSKLRKDVEKIMATTARHDLAANATDLTGKTKGKRKE